MLHDIARGGPLLRRSRSHHAKRALILAQGRTFIFLDRFLEWGVHHFHVYSNARKRDLLVYAAFDEKHAYLLAFGGHSTLNDSSLVDSMAEVCPHLLTVLKGVRGDSFTPKQLNNLRSKNAGSVISSLHGAVAPRIPYSASGLPLQVVTNVDYEFAYLNELQAVLDNPAADQYRAIQYALGTSRPLLLSVLPRETNFAGSIAFIDGECGKELYLRYR